MSAALVTVFLLRTIFVALFLLSAYSIARDFEGSRAHAMSAGIGRSFAGAMILAAFVLKVSASLAIITGVADRLGALALAVFCLITAFLYKRFWAVGDFGFRSTSPAMPVFWEWSKNVALAAAFILITFGQNAEQLEVSVSEFISNPLSSSNPYVRMGAD